MLKTVALATAIAVGVSGAAAAKIVRWSANLDAAQEVGVKVPVAGAKGTATGTLNTVTRKLTWDVTWSGLSGPADAMHFHGPAPKGKDARVVVNIGKDSGLKSPSKGSTKLSAKGVKELEEGLLYVNVHTKENPGGEIRGQVEVVK